MMSPHHNAPMAISSVMGESMDLSPLWDNSAFPHFIRGAVKAGQWRGRRLPGELLAAPFSALAQHDADRGGICLADGEHGWSMGTAVQATSLGPTPRDPQLCNLAL